MFVFPSLISAADRLKNNRGKEQESTLRKQQELYCMQNGTNTLINKTRSQYITEKNKLYRCLYKFLNLKPKRSHK